MYKHVKVILLNKRTKDLTIVAWNVCNNKIKVTHQHIIQDKFIPFSTYFIGLRPGLKHRFISHLLLFWKKSLIEGWTWPWRRNSWYFIISILILPPFQTLPSFIWIGDADAKLLRYNHIFVFHMNEETCFIVGWIKAKCSKM